jgi:hypothetical protein
MSLKTYCWNCEKTVIMKEVKQSKSNPKMIVGICKYCNTKLYKKGELNK